MASRVAAKATSSTSLSSTPSKLDVIHAYRHILRCSLSAVHRAPRAVPTVRRQVRAAFRETPAEEFDAEVVKRTGWFLKAAGKTAGVEHRVVKNLVRVAEDRRRAVANWWVLLKDNERFTKKERQREGFYQHFDMTVAMMNKSLGIALR